MIKITTTSEYVERHFRKLDANVKEREKEKYMRRVMQGEWE